MTADIGRCFDQCPTLFGITGPLCALPYGHLGSHESEHGTIWSRPTAASPNSIPTPPRDRARPPSPRHHPPPARTPKGKTMTSTERPWDNPYTGTNEPEYDGWSTRDLADRIDRGDPEAAAEVIREMAARLCDKARTATDPRTIVLDLGYAVTNLGSAVAVVLADVIEDAGEGRARAKAMLDDLRSAGNMLDEIAQGWI